MKNKHGDTVYLVYKDPATALINAGWSVFYKKEDAIDAAPTKGVVYEAKLNMIGTVHKVCN